MTYLYIFRRLAILIVTGTLLLVGCGFFQQSSSPNTSAPNNQAEQPATESTDGSNASPPAADNQAALANPEGEPSTANTQQAGPALILVQDRVTTLDPYKMVTIHPEGSVASHLWDTLTLLNDNLEVEPHLAEEWQLVNNLTWELQLRTGINFHNGEPVNAEAVRFSIDRAQSLPGSLETFANDVYLDKVEIVDEYTLRLHTHQPVVNLPYQLAFLEILPPNYYTNTDSDQLAIAPVGSGPYQLRGEWAQGQALTLDAVDTYWKGSPSLPRLVFNTIALPEERLAALRLEEAALVTDLPPLPADQWDLPGSRLEAIESTQRMFIGIRIEEGSPLADKRVRQALNYGVNVDQIVDEWLEGYAEPYGGWVNTQVNNSDLAPWPYDPDRARELLVEAGYSEGFTTTLRTPVGIYHNDAAVAEAVARQLAELNIVVSVDAISNWGVFTRQLLNDDTAPLFLLGLNSRGDALEDISYLSPDFPFNPGGWRNNSFEQVLERATNTINDSSRNRLLVEAQTIAHEEAPLIWLWKPYDFYGISETLDWMPRPDGLVNLYKPVIPPAEGNE